MGSLEDSVMRKLIGVSTARRPSSSFARSGYSFVKHTVGGSFQDKTIRVLGLLAIVVILLGVAVYGQFVREMIGSQLGIRQDGGRPNIVLIFVDDLGYNDVSYNGATEIRTPNIDRLAEEGVVFTNGYVAHPFCGPSRAGLMTGRYPVRFGMDWNVAYAPFDPDHGLPVEERTMATYLQQAGYRTGLVGKWQLGAAPPFHPLNRGFNEFFGFLGGSHDYFNVDLSYAPRRAPLSPVTEHLLPLNENYSATGFSGYLTDVLTDRAVDFIRGQDEPFFLYLAYNAPHTPLQAPAELVLKYAYIDDEPRRTYLAMVDSLDQNVGRIMRALDVAGKRDNTLIFFLSDNGGVSPYPNREDLTWADNSPLRHGKVRFFEGGIRVPFIASWPARWPQGITYDPMVISLDIAATALALADVPADADRPLDGVNLDPFMRGETTDTPHDALFWRQWSKDMSRTLYAVRAGDAKLIKDPAEGEAALFDLKSDPGETRNRIHEDPDTAARLGSLWNDWNRENSASLFPSGESYQQIVREFRSNLARNTRRQRLEMSPFQIAKLSIDEPVTPSCSNGIVVAAPEHHPGLVNDCTILLRARDTLAGNSSLDWRYDEPIYTWKGIILGGSPGRVRELRLKAHGLSGNIPAELGELDALQELYLNDNELTGSIPPELGTLTELRSLDLSKNRLTGEVPPEMGNLSNLKNIRLASNELTGCIPAALQDGVDNDLRSLGLPACISSDVED